MHLWKAEKAMIKGFAVFGLPAIMLAKEATGKYTVKKKPPTRKQRIAAGSRCCPTSVPICPLFAFCSCAAATPC